MAQHYHVDSSETGKSCHRTSYEAALKFTAEAQALWYRLEGDARNDLHDWLTKYTPGEVAANVDASHTVQRQEWPDGRPVLLGVNQAAGSAEGCEVGRAS